MSEMAAQAREFFFNPEKVIVDGVIYEVSTEGGNSVWSFNNRIETKEIGTVSEFEGLLK